MIGTKGWWSAGSDFGSVVAWVWLARVSRPRFMPSRGPAPARVYSVFKVQVWSGASLPVRPRPVRGRGVDATPSLAEPNSPSACCRDRSIAGRCPANLAFGQTSKDLPCLIERICRRQTRRGRWVSHQCVQTGSRDHHPARCRQRAQVEPAVDGPVGVGVRGVRGLLDLFLHLVSIGVVDQPDSEPVGELHKVRGPERPSPPRPVRRRPVRRNEPPPSTRHRQRPGSGVLPTVGRSVRRRRVDDAPSFGTDVTVVDAPARSWTRFVIIHHPFRGG